MEKQEIIKQMEEEIRLGDNQGYVLPAQSKYIKAIALGILALLKDRK